MNVNDLLVVRDAEGRELFRGPVFSLPRSEGRLEVRLAFISARQLTLQPLLACCDCGRSIDTAGAVHYAMHRASKLAEFDLERTGALILWDSQLQWIEPGRPEYLRRCYPRCGAMPEPLKK